MLIESDIALKTDKALPFYFAASELFETASLGVSIRDRVVLEPENRAQYLKDARTLLTAALDDISVVKGTRHNRRHYDPEVATQIAFGLTRSDNHSRFKDRTSILMDALNNATLMSKNLMTNRGREAATLDLVENVALAYNKAGDYYRMQWESQMAPLITNTRK
jgi:hypothetical protein